MKYKSTEELKEYIDSLSDEELNQLLFIDEKTGLSNRRAYRDDLLRKQYVVWIDLDGLQSIIKRCMGRAKMDELIAAFGQAVMDGYHVYGERFALLADTKEQAESAIARVQARANNIVIEGENDVLNGVSFSYGIATTDAEAEVLMRQHRQERETAGLFVPYARPPNLLRKSDLEAGKIVDSENNA